MAQLAAVPERRARFREERRFAALTEPLPSRGRLLYRRPGYLEKLTEWPEPERMVIDGGRLVITAGNEAPRVIDLGSQPELRGMVDAMRGPLAGDLQALRRRFAVAMAGGLADWTLTLTPSDAGLGKVLRSVRLAGQAAWIAEIDLVQANGDRSLTRIEPA